MKIDPLSGDNYSTLGETPNNTTLTVTYRVGGGISANIPAGDLVTIENSSIIGAVGNAGGTINTVTNDKPARGGKDEDSADEIRERTKSFFATQNRCVTKEDYEARVLNMPSKFGSIAKAYVSRVSTGYFDGLGGTLDLSPIQNIGPIVSTVQDGVTNAQTQITALQNVWNLPFTTIALESWVTPQVLLEQMQLVFASLQDAITPISDGLTTFEQSFTDLQQLPSEYEVLAGSFDAGNIMVHILGYDNNKNLVGNAHAATLFTSDSVSEVLSGNISSYLDNYRLLTDDIVIVDGYIINFGVVFEVTAHRHANKQQVKLLCIEKIKDYFNIDKMQFNQPIYISQLEYELMGVDGVRSVNSVEISQSPNNSINLWTYSWSDTNADGVINSSEVAENGGTAGYGYKYDFGVATSNGVILPSHPNNPAVFELKNPNQNIIGVVD